MSDLDFIVDNGLIDTILTALGLSSDVVVVDDYTFFYSLFSIIIALVFVLYFVVLLLRCLSSFAKGCKL